MTVALPSASTPIKKGAPAKRRRFLHSAGRCVAPLDARPLLEPPIFDCNSDPWGIHILNHSASCTKCRKPALAVEYFLRKTNRRRACCASLNGYRFFLLSADKSGRSAPHSDFRKTGTTSLLSPLTGYEVKEISILFFLKFKNTSL